jgi:DNA-binding CsgD family transcriptional regulator
MKVFNQPVKIASFLLIGTGVILFGLNIFLGGKLNVALPLVFLMLGGMFFILVFVLRQKWAWAPTLYIPGSLLLAFGLIFLLNVVTEDWNAWAYAWLLLVTGIGVGVGLANRELAWRPIASLVGWGTAAGGITLFALFGAITGGLFIQVIAPILLVLGGLALFWARPEIILPERLLQRLHLKPELDAVESPTALSGQINPADRNDLADRLDPAVQLVEPLSTRELEVLRLVDQGLSNQQIAAKLSIASSTVKTHINNIYGKLSVETRVQAIRRARDLSLLDS